MLPKNRRNRALAHAHNQWNGFAFRKPDAELAQSVHAFFKEHQIVHADHEIVVTEVGFVTMAVHVDRAIEKDDVLIVPGVDSEGLRGHLVLKTDSVPYHSLHQTADSAYREFKLSQIKADQLIANFGSRKALSEAAKTVPWYRMLKEQDFQQTGLCRWGADSFLRRHLLPSAAWRVGLPNLIVRLAGSYGERLSAASLLRHDVNLQLSEQPLPSLLAAQQEVGARESNSKDKVLN